jgi:hypothetical protein
MLIVMSLLLACTDEADTMDQAGAELTAQTLNYALLDVAEEALLSAIEGETAGEIPVSFSLTSGTNNEYRYPEKAWAGLADTDGVVALTAVDDMYAAGTMDLEVALDIERPAADIALSGSLSVVVEEILYTGYDRCFTWAVEGEVEGAGAAPGAAAVSFSGRGCSYTKAGEDHEFYIESGTVAGFDVTAVTDNGYGTAYPEI